MHLLTRTVIFSFPVIAALSCAPHAAITPYDAFNDLKQAFRKSDATAFEHQLSRDSIRKVKQIIALFALMDDRQIRALAGLYEIPADRVTSLSVREYLRILLVTDRERNVIGAATSRPIVGINRKGNSAVVRVENGMELTFIKEGPYWKFDMTEL
jgi:hypothetical protein